jgi:hypothetical protein
MKKWKQGCFLFLGILGIEWQSTEMLSGKSLSTLMQKIDNDHISAPLLPQERIFLPFNLHFRMSPYAPQLLENENQGLLEVVSEPEDGIVHKLLVAVDQNGNLLALIRQTNQEQQIILQEALFQNETSLARASGRDAIFVHGKGDRVKGGKIILKYLYDGIWNTYRQKEFSLKNIENRKWQLQTLQNVPIYRLTLRSKKLFGRLIGIDRIDVN